MISRQKALFDDEVTATRVQARFNGGSWSIVPAEFPDPVVELRTRLELVAGSASACTIRTSNRRQSSLSVWDSDEPNGEPVGRQVHGPQPRLGALWPQERSVVPR